MYGEFCKIKYIYFIYTYINIYNGWTKKVAPSNYNTGIGIYDV